MCTLLATSSNERDLGIICDKDLEFSVEISSRTPKANAIIGIIQRTFIFLEASNFTMLFNALVRPHLEYGAAVWNSQLKKNINLLENVQGKATKQVPEMKNQTYEQRLWKLKQPSL